METTVSGHESEDDITLTEPQVERNNDQNNDQNRIEHRYPLRINRQFFMDGKTVFYF